MKLSQIFGLPRLYADITKKKLPFALAYKFSKLAAEVNAELDFYRRSMDKIVDEYAEKENGNLIYTEDGDIKIIPDKVEECNAQIQELQDVDISIDITFSPTELEPLEMSIVDLQSLMPFIKE